MKSTVAILILISLTACQQKTPQQFKPFKKYRVEIYKKTAGESSIANINCQLITAPNDTVAYIKGLKLFKKNISVEELMLKKGKKLSSITSYFEVRKNIRDIKIDDRGTDVSDELSEFVKDSLKKNVFESTGTIIPQAI